MVEGVRYGGSVAEVGAAGWLGGQVGRTHSWSAHCCTEWLHRWWVATHDDGCFHAFAEKTSEVFMVPQRTHAFWSTGAATHEEHTRPDGSFHAHTENGRFLGFGPYRLGNDLACSRTKLLWPIGLA